jgi:hypothetical protein
VTKRISPAAIHALKEALSTVYWYKSDLKSFLTLALGDPLVVNRLNWEDPKRNVVGSLVDFLAGDEERHQDALIRLMLDVAAIDDFAHLERLDAGPSKAEAAMTAVKTLREYTKAHQDVLDEQEAVARRRQLAHEKRLQTQAVSEALDSIKSKYYTLIGSTAPQQRGYALERILRQLFELFDMDPRASFKITGEQIDGAFTFERTDFLLEAKWQQELVGIGELDAFAGKISRKLDNTLGLFLSINGYSPDAVSLHTATRPVMILMDGSDLMAVLEGRIELGALLLRKRRHAAQTGELFLPIHRVFG